MATGLRTVGVGLDVQQGFGRKVLNGIARHALKTGWRLSFIPVEIAENYASLWHSLGIDGLIIQGLHSEKPELARHPRGLQHVCRTRE